MQCRSLCLALIVFVMADAGLLRAESPCLGEQSPVVIVCGGVGGLENLEIYLKWAVQHTGVPCDVRGFDWTHGKGHIFKDLQDTQNHAQKTAELAEEVRRVCLTEPGRPIILIGRSGGSVLALGVAEMLPPQTLERIILLSAAVSPGYDLKPALRATRKEIVSFRSELDWFVLGWGTWQFGTADRLYCSSAGKCGFNHPPESDAEGKELYRRLVEICWTPSMLLHGNNGGHIGTVMPSFLASDVVPWLKP
jgi:pimeloyl-ACP methyl ester carboxylesterase